VPTENPSELKAVIPLDFVASASVSLTTNAFDTPLVESIA